MVLFFFIGLTAAFFFRPSRLKSPAVLNVPMTSPRHGIFSSTASPFELVGDLVARLQLGIVPEFNASGAALPGIVTRCAVKPQNQSRAKGWTTYKPPVPLLVVGVGGAGGDYNHYRTVGMKGTNDRALSIITQDVLESLEAAGWPLTDGDLGQNVLVTGFPYAAFVVGRRYLLGGIMVQISEPIQPCGYLCTLPFLRAKSQCDEFLRALKGRRGWYARVLTPGQIHVGDSVLAL